MKNIFENLGFNVEGGEFVYAHKDKTEPQAMLNIVKGMKEGSYCALISSTPTSRIHIMINLFNTIR